MIKRMENLFICLFLTLPFAALGMVIGLGIRLRHQKGLGSALLMIFTIFIFLVTSLFAGLEGYYRWIADSTDSFALNRITQRWLDRHHRFNSLGFRDDREYPLEIPDGKSRITFLGDSFTAGHGIANPESRFVNLIRRKHPDWDIHIFARNGWDTGAEIMLMEATLTKGYRLDTVVLIYALNDIADITPEWLRILKQIYQDDKENHFFIRNSYFINTLYHRYRASRDPNISNYYSFVKGAYEGPVWEEQKARLLALTRKIREAGGQLVVVTLPFFHRMEGTYDYLEIHRQLDQFWRDQSVPHLDLYPVYLPHQNRKLMISRYDAHPNEHAHAIAADAISEFLIHQQQLRAGTIRN